MLQEANEQTKHELRNDKLDGEIIQERPLCYFSSDRKQKRRCCSLLEQGVHCFHRIFKSASEAINTIL